jgi:hypothetical protein
VVSVCEIANRREEEGEVVFASCSCGCLEERERRFKKEL